jgi:asparagine synthetase B (glutamine-hydrolysing)
MFFAAWWRDGRPTAEPIALGVRAMLDAPGAVRANQGAASVAAWAPGCLERQGQAFVAYAVESKAGRAPRGHPSVQWDGGTLRGILGPLPEYPLYYVRAPGDRYILLCSRLEPLARLLPEAPLNTQRLVYVLRSAEVPGLDPATTAYAGIRRLRPCETLIANQEGVRIERNVPRIGTTYRRGRPEDLAFEMREQLDRAVGRAMDGAKRVAVFVSGGLDSSAVLALAAARCRGATRAELKALSVQFAAPEDDRPYFDELMEALGMTPVRRSPRDVGKWLEQSLGFDGQPGQASSTCLFLMLSSVAVECKADATLHGGIGDNIVGGTIPYAQLALRGHPLAAVIAAWRMRVPWPTTAWGRVRSLVLAPLLPRRVSRWRRRRAAHAPWLTARSIALLNRCQDSAPPPHPLPDTPDAWMRALCDDEGEIDSADCAGQVLALTGCAPVDVFLDSEFIRFVLQIDPILLSHGHEYRGLYRLAMKGVLPERLRTRQDKGRFEPGVAAAALGADAVDMLRDLASLQSLRGRGLVDPIPFGPIFDLWLAAVRRGERVDSDPADERWEQVWQLLSIEAFLRKHGRGRDLA